MLRLQTLTVPLWLLAAFGGAYACTVEREIDYEGGVHPPGFAVKDNAEFHGAYLKSITYKMGTCRGCHGDDYSGGAVGFSCNQSGCHENGVEWCGTCHNGKAPPQPETGAHNIHTFGCQNCHTVPQNAREYAHPNGVVGVAMVGLAEHLGNTPQWDPNTQTCKTTYCHGSQSPEWEMPQGPLPCNTCNASPPDSHKRFPISDPPEGCEPCHGKHEDPTHLNGQIDVFEPSCTQCHGSLPDGAPPPALDGSMSPSSRGVGAHTRHLDSALPDRMGQAVECVECHDVPAEMRANGHMDLAAPADVRFIDGEYNIVNGSCVVSCHWNKDPGPLWTDTSGAPRACDGCHDYPPLLTREGTPHPAVEASAETCQLCHQFSPSTHVDGHVDFLK
ncbi:MAG: hypothetical protein IPK82_19250 [Polyangiaceae bacterium]|nr:hypothetical protein [Polyangiaceae bacterium]